MKISPLMRSVLRTYRWQVIAGLGTLVLVDILEVIPPILLKLAVDVVTEGQGPGRLDWIAAGFLLVALLQGFGRYGWRMLLIRSSLFGGRDIRRQFTSHLFTLPQRFFDQRRLGDLMSLSTNDTEAIRMALGPGLLVAADALFYFVTVPAAMLWLSPGLTLLAFLPLPIIPWLVARNEKLLHSRFEKVQESFGRLSALAQETLTGIRVLKAFAAEAPQMERFRKEGEEYLRLNMAMSRVQNSFGPTLDFTMSMGLVVLLWIGGSRVIGGVETLGTFVAFQRYIQKMVWPMAAVGMAISYYQRSRASSDRIQSVLDEKSEITPAPADSTAVPGPRAIAGEIEFRNLSFRYRPEAEWAIRDFSLRVPAQARVAFVGPVGSGKSTLLSLVPRLYAAPAGSILLDGRDLAAWDLAELRASIGHVGQELFLFSESVEHNLSWGLADLLPPMERDRLLREVALYDDMARLPEGFNTRLGERGVNLSGGQKQRLTIGRALARNPRVLILDDALSAVDTQTESVLLRSLRSREGRSTELIAGHRISTVQDADWIVVMDRGRIVQQGTHRTLLAERSGLYFHFYQQQQIQLELERELADHGQSQSIQTRL